MANARSAVAPEGPGCGWTRPSAKRINENRTDEALAVGPDLVAAACPLCIVMLTDGVNLRQQQGRAPETLEVTDVSEVLLRSVRTAETDTPAPATVSRPEGKQP